MARCAWCGTKGDLFEIEIDETKISVCTPEHQKIIEEQAEVLKKKLPLFWIGLGLGMVTLITGAIFASTNPSLNWLPGIGLGVVGATIVVAPLVTPQTIAMMGLKKGMLIARGLGAAMVVGSIGVIISVFLS